MRNYSIRPRDDGRAAKRVLAMPLARANGWFDDEIAIDFPSLHAAVERMRACFVASADWDHRAPALDRAASVAARSVPRRHGAARRAGSQAVSRMRRARRNLVGPVRRVRWQRRGPWPPSRTARRPAAGAGRRSICPLGFCSVRSAHARRSDRRTQLSGSRFYRSAVLGPEPQSARTRNRSGSVS